MHPVLTSKIVLVYTYTYTSTYIPLEKQALPAVPTRKHDEETKTLVILTYTDKAYQRWRLIRIKFSDTLSDAVKADFNKPKDTDTDNSH